MNNLHNCCCKLQLLKEASFIKELFWKDCVNRQNTLLTTDCSSYFLLVLFYCIFASYPKLYILNYLLISHINQNITLLGGQGKLKNYPDINDKRGVSIYYKRSLTLKKYWNGNTMLTSAEINENYNFFKNDINIQSIDAFVCGFPASMCQLWMPFNPNQTEVFGPLRN